MLVNGRYQVLRALRGNPLGEAYLAQDVQYPERRYVLKPLNLAVSDPQSAQLIRELLDERISSLEGLVEINSCLTGIFGCLEVEGQLCVIRDWIEGTTLTCRVQKGGVLSQSEAESILFSLLEDLSDLHETKTFHGNIKPSNIILQQPDRLPILTDFSPFPIAVRVGQPTPPPPTSGTPSPPNNPTGFIAPEQAAGQIFYASDLYSLGLTLVYLVTGRSPQELGVDPQTGLFIWRPYAPQVDSTLADLLDAAIHPDPQQRYVTATEMLRIFQETIAPPPEEKSGSRVAPPASLMLSNLGPLLKVAIAALLLYIGFSTVKRFLPANSSATDPGQTAVTSLDPSASATPNPSTTTSPETPLSPTPAAPITEEQAVTLVNQWLASKQQLFSPPYNRNLAAQLTTDPLYTDIIKPGGSIDWLTQNNARYEFKTSQVQSVGGFVVSGTQATLEVTVMEDRTLYIGNTVDAAQSGSGTSQVRYLLRPVNGQWRIADYQSIQ